MTDVLVKGSDNDLTWTLQEDGVAISVPTYTSVFLHFEHPRTQARVLTITRTSNVNGVSLSSAGVLTITPGDLTEGLTELVAGLVYRMLVELETSSLTNGAYYGEDDGTPFYVHVKDPA